MNKTTDTTAAQAAAQWWASAIGAPTFDNGDGLQSMLGTLLAAGKPAPTVSEARSFADILAARIQTDLDRCREYGDLSIGVDYVPDRILAEAAREAGISTLRFPWKTMMWVNDDHVTVSAGYRAPTVLVWASEEWLANRPVCGTQKWDESKTGRDYGGEPWTCSLPKYHDEQQHRFDSPLTLCAQCGRPDDWHHDREERGHMPDFHTFEAPVG